MTSLPSARPSRSFVARRSASGFVYGPFTSCSKGARLVAWIVSVRRTAPACEIAGPRQRPRAAGGRRTR